MGLEYSNSTELKNIFYLKDYLLDQNKTIKIQVLKCQENINLNVSISACAICGVLCISLPIPIIVNNFNKFYEKAKIEEEITAKKKKSAWDDCQKGEKIV